MSPQNDWDATRGERGWLFGTASLSAVGVALLFGSAAVAFALIAAPIAENYARPQYAGAPGLDMTTTGSTARTTSYTVRRSVLQASPDSVCTIRPNGMRSGDC